MQTRELTLVSLLYAWEWCSSVIAKWYQRVWHFKVKQKVSVRYLNSGLPCRKETKEWMNVLKLFVWTTTKRQMRVRSNKLIILRRVDRGSECSVNSRRATVVRRSPRSRVQTQRRRARNQRGRTMAPGNPTRDKRSLRLWSRASVWATRRHAFRVWGLLCCSALSRCVLGTTTHQFDSGGRACLV